MGKWLLLMYMVLLIVLVNIHVYAALAYIVVTVIVAKAYMPQLKGYVGEKRVERKLRRLGNEYTAYHDVYLRKDNGTLTQVDHIVTSPFGIFVIETKNYAGRIVGAEHERYWKQLLPHTTSTFYSPIFQNHGHIQALQHMLELDVPVYSIVVFSNRATLHVSNTTEHVTVLPMRRLMKHMKTYNEITITKEQLQAIHAALQASIAPNYFVKRQLKKEHLQQVRTYQKAAKTSRENGAPQRCPLCGSALRQRRGKFGTFYGCSRFPACRYTT